MFKDIFVKKILPFVMLVFFVVGCRPSDGVPRPEGYFRIDRLDTSYMAISIDYPVTFEISSLARCEQDVARTEWLNIAYPHYAATLWCCYIPLTRENYYHKLLESRELVYVHLTKSTEILAQSYADEMNNKFAMVYILGGDTATPLQFEVTDSTTYLFRGALYFDAPVRRDSVAPVVDYIADDVYRIVESLKSVR